MPDEAEVDGFEINLNLRLTSQVVVTDTGPFDIFVIALLSFLCRTGDDVAVTRGSSGSRRV